jgi:Recombinase
MHPPMHYCCTVYKMSRRRHERKVEKAHRHASPPRPVRQTDAVERLAYSIAQAAEALGVNPTTVSRAVVPVVETIETEWGQRLIPVDELERYVAERRRPARPRPRAAPVGRPPAVPPKVVERICAEHAAGKTLGQIARDLDADQVPTAQDGRRWWPSSVRAVVLRSTPA